MDVKLPFNQVQYNKIILIDAIEKYQTKEIAKSVKNKKKGYIVNRLRKVLR